MEALSAKFLTSFLIVEHNAIKNILFRVATLILNFVILRLFGLVAFRRSDYTSFLMFAEDVIQKAFFVVSRGITARQSLLVGMFALIATAGEFYNTMLWAIDNPGYVTRHSMVNGATLAAQMVNVPDYVTFVAANNTNPSGINNLNTTFRADLYAPGLNFSLPGVFQEGIVEVVPPPSIPIDPFEGINRVWLDDEGFAIGLDFTVMTTINMTRSLDTECFLHNNTNADTNTQGWNCNVPNGEASGMLQSRQGMVPIWWDACHVDWLVPNNDNPWVSMGSNGGTIMMKQVFTVTKGHRRHTFLATVIKASMSTPAPNTLADGEISDFMRRTWSTDRTITGPVQERIDAIVDAKENNTGRTFGDTFQTNASLAAESTDYLNVANATGGYYYSVLRFVSTNVTLIRSESLAVEPIPLVPCPGTVYRNYATDGIPITTNCNSPEIINQTWPSGQGHFLGQIDTSAVARFVGFLGDGSSNLSAVALTDTGIDWISQQNDHMDHLLISRAMLLGGNSTAVMVEVGTNVAAISGLQLLLCILPAVLATAIWWFTRATAMSYYKNSFLSAVLATTHTTATPCDELGYIRLIPEITPPRRGRHVTLGTPHEGTILNRVTVPIDDSEMVYEPLVVEKNRM